MLPLVGAFGDVRDDATAFGGSRSLRYVFAIEGISMDEETFTHDRRWVRDTWDALRPAAVHDGAYVNLMAEFEGDSLRATYGAAKFDRLRRIKGVYDPENVFRHNANIPPA
jgi:FAD/FMN-containing dehydrogenase